MVGEKERGLEEERDMEWKRKGERTRGMKEWRGGEVWRERGREGGRESILQISALTDAAPSIQ